jgi:small subunit ribosomal protein S2
MDLLLIISQYLVQVTDPVPVAGLSHPENRIPVTKYETITGEIRGFFMGLNSLTMKSLLEAGVHFGHQTRRWNPKMARYIYAERNGVYILDLQKTMRQMKRAYKYLTDVSKKGGEVMIVSTKKQSEDNIKAAAERGGMFYVNQRWLGGMLTNFQTISRRIKHMKKLEKMEKDGLFEAFSKKEESMNRKQLGKLQKYLNGIRDMVNIPDAIIIIDPRRENIALKEAQRLNVPVIAIVDTNCDPEGIDFPIPGNDDAIRAIEVVVNYLVDAIVEGKNQVAKKAAPKAEAKAEEKTEAKAAAPAEEKAEEVKEEAVVVASASPEEA